MKIVAYISGSMLLLELLKSLFFRGWYFINISLKHAEIICIPILMFVFIASLISINQRNLNTFFAIAIPLCTISGCVGYLDLHPIDTEYEPMDISVIYNQEGERLLKRGIFNPKHNTWRYDTVAIEEKWIFRKVIN